MLYDINIDIKNPDQSRRDRGGYGEVERRPGDRGDSIGLPIVGYRARMKDEANAERDFRVECAWRGCDVLCEAKMENEGDVR